MKARMSLALVALMILSGIGWAQSGSKADEDKIIQNEKQLWEAWKDHKNDPFKEHLAENGLSMTMNGPMDKAQTIDEMGKTNCSVSSYSLEDTRVTWLDKNTALLTYRGNQDATCDGQKIPSSVWASSVWVKKNGKWEAAFHQETPSEQAMRSMSRE